MPTPTLNYFLVEQKIPHHLRHLLTTIAITSKYISHAIQTGDLGLAGTSNLYGEDQLALDVLADRLIAQHLRESGLVSALVSEESTEVQVCTPDIEEPYMVAYDPLDGSSLVDANLAIGSIFAIFPGKKDFLGMSGRDLVASAYVVYGPRTTMVIALPNGVHEFLLNEIGEYHLCHEKITLENSKKYFAPGGLHSVEKGCAYDQLISHWYREGYKLRYSGGMVPDINHLLSKRGGIFAYPNLKNMPEGKLRLLFECLPMGFIIEKAGGVARDGLGNNILDKKVEQIDQRTPILLGSRVEVEQAESILLK